jgi:hypothetical protein
MKNNLPSLTADEQDEQFELAFRLIQRYDHHLDSLESRAATIISADALLLAGTTFLVDKVLLPANQFPFIKQIFIGISIGLALIVLALSIVYAATSIANVWRTTGKIVGRDLLQPSLFFRSSETLSEIKNFPHFKKHFQSSSKEQILTYVLFNWDVENVSEYSVLRN